MLHPWHHAWLAFSAGFNTRCCIRDTMLGWLSQSSLYSINFFKAVSYCWTPGSIRVNSTSLLPYTRHLVKFILWIELATLFFPFGDLRSLWPQGLRAYFGRSTDLFFLLFTQHIHALASESAIMILGGCQR